MADLVSMEQVLGAVIVIVSWVIAYLEHKKKTDVIAVMSDPVALPDPDRVKVIDALPSRSWTMSADTLSFILVGEDDADRGLIRAQIEQAERARQLRYQITYSRGGYIIEYGLIKSSWRS